MKNIDIYLAGKHYEISLEDGFFEYIKDDIDKLNKSNNQLKELLNLVLSSKNILYENDKKMKKILKKLEKL